MCPSCETPAESKGKQKRDEKNENEKEKEKNNTSVHKYRLAPREKKNSNEYCNKKEIHKTATSSTPKKELIENAFKMIDRD